MRNYKDFPQIYIGESDIASITIRSVLDVAILNFGEDGIYFAYECEGNNIEIGSHYRKIFSGKYWIKIFDDSGLVYNRRAPEEMKYIDVYRAGDFGCIIHYHS